MVSLERASQEEQNDANFSFIAPSSEELWAQKEILYIQLLSTFLPHAPVPGLATEGLYRISGKSNEVLGLKKQFDHGEDTPPPHTHTRL